MFMLALFLCTFSFLAAFLEATKFLRKIIKSKNDRKFKMKIEMLRLSSFQGFFFTHHIFELHL